MAADFSDIGVVLQVGAGYVQRNVWRIDNAMQQSEEFRNYSFDRIRYKNLVAVKLDFIFLNLEIIFQFGEIENPRQVKRIINIQVNVEERFIGHGV